MAIFNVRFYKEYEAHIQIEAETAEEAGEMVRNGDFSQAVEDTYSDDMSEEYIYGGCVFAEDDEEENDLLFEWNDR